MRNTSGTEILNRVVKAGLTQVILLLLFSRSVISDSFRPHGLQHTRLPCPSLSPRACPNSGPLSRWCHPTISSSVVPFSCFLSFPASRTFPMSQFFASGGQSIGASASASVLPVNVQGWFPLGWTGWLSLCLVVSSVHYDIQYSSSQCVFSVLEPSLIYIPVSVCLLSCVWLFAAPWTIAHQVPLLMEFSRQEYWNRLPFPTPGDLPEPGIEPVSPASPAVAGRFFTTSPSGKPGMERHLAFLQGAQAWG